MSKVLYTHLGKNDDDIFSIQNKLKNYQLKTNLTTNAGKEIEATIAIPPAIKQVSKLPEQVDLDNEKLIYAIGSGKATELYFAVDNPVGYYTDAYDNNTLGDYAGCTHVAAIPSTPKLGDILVTDAYEYRYQKQISATNSMQWEDAKQKKSKKFRASDPEGWGVRALHQRLVEYPEIDSTLNILYMNSCFYGCQKLTEAPAIPKSVIDLSKSFQNCLSLKKSPELPQTAGLNLTQTFQNCVNMSEGPNLINAQILTSTFENCPKLTGTIVIDTNPTDFSDCFLGTSESIQLSGEATNLEDIARTSISKNISIKGKLTGTYYINAVNNNTLGNYEGCLKADAIPKKPSFGDIYVDGIYEYRYGKLYFPESGQDWINVDMLNSQAGFLNAPYEYSCSIGWGVSITASLTQRPSIPSISQPMLDFLLGEPVDGLSFTFAGCQNIVSIPNIPVMSKLCICTFAQTKITTVPPIPKSVQMLYSTFAACDNLSGTIQIDAEIALPKRDMMEMFLSPFQQPKKPLHLTGSSPWLAELAAQGGSNTTYTPDIEYPTIPFNGKYYTNIPDTYTEGSNLDTLPGVIKCTEFPEISQPGDIYIDNDTGVTYRYCYRYYYGWEYFGNNPDLIMLPQSLIYVQHPGWGVLPPETLNQPISILSYINKKPVISVAYLNSNQYDTLNLAPPETAEDLEGIYDSCNLTSFNIKIPKNAKNLRYAFQGATGVKSLTLPEGVEIIDAFCKGSDIETISDIPASVKFMRGAFYNCKQLKSCGNILANIVTDINGIAVDGFDYAFRNCENLESLGSLPNQCSRLHYSFENCKKLSTINALPKNLTEAQGAFRGCTSLVTAPELPATCMMLKNTFRGCTSLITAPTIPAAVSDLTTCFTKCSALTGIIEINASELLNFGECFANTIKPIQLTGSCTKLAELAATATANNVTVL